MRKYNGNNLALLFSIFYFYDVVKEHFLLAFGWIVFCVLHSLFASTRVKQELAKTPGIFKYYRLYYTFFAFVNFAAIIIYQLSVSSPYIFSPIAISYAIGVIMGSIGLAIMLVCIKKYFGNLSGLKTLFIDEFRTGNTLVVTGMHRYVRHPLYVGTFLFIWGLFICLPYASLLISNFIITFYTLIGIGFEEQKLLREFGPSYEEYKRRVPKIIPSFK